MEMTELNPDYNKLNHYYLTSGMILEDAANAADGRTPRATRMLAGGYVRDTLLDKDPKDFDFFVPTSGAGGANRIIQGLTRVIGPPDKNSLDNKEDAKQYVAMGGLLIGVVTYNNLPLFDGLPVQFVFTQADLNQTLKNFDFGICQVGFGNDGLKMTHQFMRDVTNKTCTLHNTHSKERSLKRYESWLSRGYEDYELVDMVKDNS